MIQKKLHKNQILMKTKNLHQLQNYLRKSAIIALMLTFMVLLFSLNTTAQETVSTLPAWDGTHTVNICVGGTITVTITNTNNGNTYKIQKTLPTPSLSIQNLMGTGGTIQSDPIAIFSSPGSYTIGVVDLNDGVPFENFTVIVNPDPIAPTLTLSQVEGSINAGTAISASLNSAGSGGYGNMVDAYEFSIDNGASWNPYTLGSLISSTQFKIPSVKIKAKRYDTESRGCASENIYTWDVISRVHDVTGAQGSYFSIQQAIDASSTASGDVLEVDAGTYPENIQINKANLTLKSITQFAAIIQTQSGFNAGSGYGGITFLADGSTLDGFKIEQSVDQAIIHTHNSNNVTIKNNWIIGLAPAAPRGIDLGYASENSDGVILKDNKFEDLYCGVYINQASNLTIDDNDFIADMGDGCIVFDGTWNYNNINIINNTATNADYLMYFYGSPQGAVTHSSNTLTNTLLSNWKVTNLTKSIFYATIQDAVTGADATNVIEVAEGVCQLTALVDVNKQLTIQGKGRDNTIVELSSSWFNVNGPNAFTLSAAGIIIKDLHFKVVGKGQGNILGIFQSNTEIRNNKFSGEYVLGDDEVTRATVWSANNMTGIVMDNNIIENLRQPGYIDNGSGTISNNTFSITRGWVIAGAGSLAITGNTWGTNSSHITILTGANISGLTINNNNLSGTKTDWAIDNRTTQVLNATCNWFGTADYSTIIPKNNGPIVFVPYMTSNGGACDGGIALPANLNVTYTEANEDIFVAFDVTGNKLELKPVPGINPSDPNYLTLVAARYIALSTAMQTGTPAEIQAAALGVGDDIITEYYYLDGTTKVYLKTIGSNDLVKQKYWSDYLNSSTNVKYPNWTAPRTLISQDNYRTSTNPLTGSVAAGWLNQALGRDLFVKVTFIHNGNVNSITQSVAITAGCIVNKNTGLGYSTIQAAINATETQSGHVIEVCPGTFNETVTINKSIHLRGQLGQTDNTFIMPPAGLPVAADPLSSIIIVSGAGVNAEISGLTVKGPGPTSCGSIGRGIFVRDGATANIHDNKIHDIRDNAVPLSGCQNGIAIQVGRNAWTTSGTATIANNIIEGYQKGAIIVDNTGSSATISGNTISGIGTTAITAQNGIQISRGATATISNNTVSGNSYNASTVWDWGACGILLYQSGSVALTGGNTLSGNDNNYYAYGGITGTLALGAETFGTSTAPVTKGYQILVDENINIDASLCNFEGISPASANLTQLFAIEDRIWHSVDDPAKTGFVKVKAGNVYVTRTETGAHIQYGIDAAIAGDVVHVQAGDYGTETAANRSIFGTGNYQFGLFIDKNNLTVKGYKSGDVPVATASEAAVLFNTGSTADFGPSGIFVLGNNVSIEGLKIGDNYDGASIKSNKTIEVIGDAFTMNKCFVNTSSDEGALYLGRWGVTHPIVSYSITNNIFNNSLVSVNNGVGITGPNTGRLITGNEFTGVATPYLIGFRGWNGASPVQGWIVDPVGGAVVTGNTFSNTGVTNYIIARGNAGGYANSELNWNEIWTSNTYGNHVVTLSDQSTFAVRAYTDAAGYTETRRISPLIQENVTIGQANDVVLVSSGTFNEDVIISSGIKLLGQGYANTTIVGQIGGDGATIRVSSPNVIIDGFAITRVGNNTTDWNNAGLNSAGIAMQGQTVFAEVRNCSLYGNRTGIDINNSNSNNIHNNIIDNNRTGLILRNQTDNTTVVENFISNNWTIGLLFLDGSGGTNSPVQTAINSTFSNNNISGNWYGDIQDRQSGGSIPAPGTIMKNFECNWHGTTAPVVTAINSTEPGYAAQIPVIYGGTAVPPTGTQPDIFGTASANLDYVGYLINGSDNNVSSIGFQPAPGACGGTPVEIISAVPDQITCGESTGSILVTWSGGAANYNLTWTGGGVANDITGNSYSISGLAKGFVDITVTEANGTSDTKLAVEVKSLPVANTTDGIYFATIQEAINASTTVDGEVIEVCAGTYAEHVVIDKALDIRGPNFGKNPNTESRNPEALIVPEANLMPADPWTEVVWIKSNNVSFKGFKVSGDNPLLSGYSYAGMDLEKGQGVYSEGSNITFSNNIIENATTMGFFAGGTQSTQYQNLVVSNNKIDKIHDVAALGYGFGFYIQGTAGTIDNNVVTNVRNGIQVQPYRVVKGGSTPVLQVKDNDFAAYKTGIYYNYAEVGASAWTIESNDVTVSAPPVTPEAPLAWVGINSETMISTGNGGLITSNTVNGTGATIGSNWSAIKGMQYTGNASNSTQVFYTNNTVSNVPVGFVHNAVADIVFAGNNISASEKAIDVTGAFNINATGGNTINGVATLGASNAQLFVIEDAINHKIDESTRGLVTVKANNLYVTPLSFVGVNTTPLIQRGIDAASSGWIVNINSGTYTSPVNINKGIKLYGLNSEISPVIGSRSPEAILSTTSGIMMNVSTTEPVEIKGLEFANSGGPYDYSLSGGVGTTIDLQKNYFNNSIGVYLPNAVTTTIADNLCTFSSGADEGFALFGNYNGSTGTLVNIHDNKFLNGQMTGFNLSNIHGAIYHNIFDHIAYYGVLVANLSNLDIYENEFKNIVNPDNSVATFGSGVRFYDDAPGMTVSVHNNTFINNYVGIGARPAFDFTGQNILVNNNTITGSTTFDILNQGIGTLNATCNWFGTTSASSVAAHVQGNVDYTPWLTDGTDGSLAIGFQLTGSCDETAPILTVTGFTADGIIDMPGNLTAGYKLNTTNVANLDRLVQFKTGTVANETLAAEFFGLKLISSTVSAANLKAYYATRGVPEPYLSYLNDAADGTKPFVYINGSTVKLVDAAKHDLATTDVDMTIPDNYPLGTYTVEGKIKDHAGNEATVTFKLIVDGDRVAPVITLLGITPAEICKGGTYIDAGATASDDVNGDITSSIIPTSTVNTNMNGTYTVTYNVTDAAGNAAIPVIRTVIVNPLPTATIAATQTQSVCSNASAEIKVDLIGTAPWSITYSDGTTPVIVTNILTSPYIISVSPLSNTTYTVTNVADANCSNSSNASAKIYVGPITTIGSIADACVGSNVTVPLTVTSFAEVGAISLTIKYDPAILTFVSGSVNPAIVMGNLAISGNTPGVIKIGGFISETETALSLTDNAQLCNLTFTYLGGTANIEFDDATDPTDCNYGFGDSPDFTDFCDIPTATYYKKGTITKDAIAPTAVCQNITVNLDPSGNATITAEQVNNGSSDACGIASMSVSPSLFTCANIGANTVTLTVTDNSGNVSNCSATITVKDVTPPTPICKNLVVQLDQNGTASIIASQIDNGSSDVCSAVSLSVSPNNFTCLNLGPNTVILTVTDVSGNSSTCNATVTVEDKILPAITCAADITQDNDLASCGAIVTITNPSSTDNCTVASVAGVRSDNLAMNAVYPKGETTITWTATDQSGNSVNCLQKVTISDNEVPVIVCPANVTVEVNASSNPSATGFATATDNCTASPVITFSDVWAAGSCVGTGIITRTWTAKDEALKTATCVQKITIIDTNTPAISCPDDITVNNAIGLCNAVVNFNAPVSNDPGYNESWDNENYVSGDYIGWAPYNSQISRVSTGTNGINAASGAGYGLAHSVGIIQTGVFSRVGSYSSIFGNGYRIRQSVYMDLNDQAVTANTYGWDLSAASSSQVGAHLRDFIFHTASNASGQILVAGSNNSNGAKRNDLASLNHYTITSSGWYTFEFVFRNNAGVLAVDLNLLNNSNTVLWTETRSNPADLISTVVGGNRYLWFTFLAVDNLAIDNTSIERLTTVSATPASGTAFPVGTTTVTTTSSDACGNNATCTFTVKVNDTEKPVITRTGDATVYVCQNEIYTDAGATATDNCGGSLTASIVKGGLPINTSVSGTYTVTYDVSDAALNAAVQVTRTVIVRPLPVVNTVALQTSTDEASWSAISGTLALGYEMCIDPAVSYHYYDINTLTSSEALLSSAFVQNAFKLDVTSVPSGFFTYWAAKGVTSAATGWQGVMWQIINGNAPMFYIQKDGTDYKLIDGLQYQISASTQTLRINGEYPSGNYTFRGTVTDANGCVSLPFDVNLKLNSAPVITCPANKVVSNDLGVCGASVTFAATATGTLPVDITYMANSVVITSPHIFPVGTTTVTATASNACKTVTCTFTVKVNDTENPVITSPTSAPFYYANNGCTWTGAGLEAVIADNCGTPVLSHSINGEAFVAGNVNGYPFPIGTTNVVYKVTDASGNSAECSFTITVKGATLSGIVNYNNAANTPMNLVTVTLRQGSTDVYTGTTDVNGSYSFTDVCPGVYQVAFNTVKPVGGINSTDAAQVNAWSLGVYPIETVRFLAGDVSAADIDGKLRTNANDAGMILDYFVNGVVFDKPWEFWKAGETVNSNPQLNTTLEITIPSPSLSPSVTQNFLGLASGDFNRNFVPTNNKSVGGASKTLTLLHGDGVPVLPLTTIDLPVKAVSAMQVGAISLILNYPVNKLQVEGVFLQDKPDQPLVFNAKDGELRIGWYSKDPISVGTGDVMLTVRLKTTGDIQVGEVYHFELAGNQLNELANGECNVISDAKLIMDGLAMKPGVTVGIEIPERFDRMELNGYPNPFRENARIEYTLPEDGHVSLEITSIVGSRIILLSNQQQTAGEYSTNFDGNKLTPGVYQITLRLKTRNDVLIKTIQMVKQ